MTDDYTPPGIPDVPEEPPADDFTPPGIPDIPQELPAEPVGESLVVGANDRPIEHACHGAPTHVLWHADAFEFVHPEGYDPEELSEIDPAWLQPFMVPDYENQTFVPDLDAARAAKWEAVKAFRDARRYGGCMTPSGRIDTDLESQHKLNGAVTMAMVAGEQFTVHWTMEDNSVFPMDAPTMIAAGVAVGAYDATCHAIGQWLRGEIEIADDLEAITAIDIVGAPWPS